MLSSAPLPAGVFYVVLLTPAVEVVSAIAAADVLSEARPQVSATAVVLPKVLPVAPLQVSICIR